MDFKRLAMEIVKIAGKYRYILIYIKGSPDPDAIAASYALKLILEHYGTKADIESPVFPSLPQNVKMVKDLHLPVHFGTTGNHMNRYDAYAVLDHQSAVVEGVTGVIPCAFHIDHHEPVEDHIPVDMPVRSRDAGSASTIMAFILEELAAELNFNKKIRMRAATALYYGIQTDTDNFKHCEDLDEQAVDIISPECDKRLLRDLSAIPFSKEFMDFFNRALEGRIIYKDWLISGIGFIDEKHRDVLSIIGDFLLKREEISTAVVFSIVEKKKGLTLDVSFRTKAEDFNLNELIKRITSEGGGRKFKGAYQVNLDYFIHCTDRDLLWQAVSTTTIEVLKSQRDTHGFDGIKNYFRRLGGKFLNLFR